jgi:hypothetical protein
MHACAVDPTTSLHAVLSLHLGIGLGAGLGEPRLEVAPLIVTLSVTHTGVPGSKQHAPAQPLAVLLQLVSFAPG